MKRYDAGTRLDARDRVIGHSCAGDPGCRHCERSPVAYPVTWSAVSDRTLRALDAVALGQITAAVAALDAMRTELAKRGGTDADD